MAATRYRGKSGQLKIGTAASEVTLAVKSFSFKHHVDGLEVTDTGNSGQRDYEDGLEHCEGSFDACWKATAAPFGATYPLLKAGQTPNLILKVNSTDGNPLYTGPIYIEDVEVDVPVDGVVTYKVQWKSKPGFTVDDGQT